MNIQTLAPRLLVAGAFLLLSTTVRAQDATVPDDFSTIGAALNGASDTNGNGTLEIFVRGGIYAENVRIARSNVRLTGDAANRPTIRGDGTVHVVYVESFTNATLSNVTIENLIVTGGGPANDGVELSRVNGGVLDNVEAFGNAEGLRWNRGNGGAVRHSLAHDNAHSGIQLTGVLNAVVESNVTHDNGSSGIDLGSVLDLTVQGNDCRHNRGSGIRARRANGVTATANLLHDNASDGARFESVTGLQFLGNTCDANLENGLRTNNTLNCLFSLNQVTNNQKFGVRRRNAFGDDYDAAASGLQDPIGDNTFSGNSSGNVRND